MLEENKKPEKEAKNAPEVKEEVKDVITKDYTLLKPLTTDKINAPGSTVSVVVGSDQEKYLLTNKIVNKHGISRPN